MTAYRWKLTYRTMYRRLAGEPAVLLHLGASCVPSWSLCQIVCKYYTLLRSWKPKWQGRFRNGGVADRKSKCIPFLNIYVILFCLCEKRINRYKHVHSLIPDQLVPISERNHSHGNTKSRLLGSSVSAGTYRKESHNKCLELMQSPRCLPGRVFFSQSSLTIRTELPPTVEKMILFCPSKFDIILKSWV